MSPSLPSAADIAAELARSGFPALSVELAHAEDLSATTATLMSKIIESYLHVKPRVDIVPY